VPLVDSLGAPEHSSSRGHTSAGRHASIRRHPQPVGGGDVLTNDLLAVDAISPADDALIAFLSPAT